MIDPAATLRRRPDVRYRVIDGQAVVIVQESAEALVLNEVGTRILDLIDGERSVATVLERIEREFEVETDQLAHDVMGYLESLLEAQVVEAIGDAGDQ